MKMEIQRENMDYSNGSKRVVYSNKCCKDFRILLKVTRKGTN